jgi:hypothetical protein
MEAGITNHVWELKDLLALKEQGCRFCGSHGSLSAQPVATQTTERARRERVPPLWRAPYQALSISFVRAWCDILAARSLYKWQRLCVAQASTSKLSSEHRR